MNLILFLSFFYLQVWFLCILCTQSSVEKELGAENACRVSEVLWNPLCFVKVDQSLCRENIFALTLFRGIRDFYFPIRSFAHRCPDHHMNINDGVINHMSQHCKCFIYDRVKSPYGLLDELSTWHGTKLTESATVVQGLE